MPYKIVKNNDQFCVAKADTGEVIKGGCHAGRGDATSHLQALYANEAMAAVAESFCDETEITLSDGELATWAGPIAFEGVSTGDNRSFSKDSIAWNDLPVPLLWQKMSQDGHSGSWVIGRVDHIEKKDGQVFAKGVLLDTEEANQYKQLLEAGAAGGVSIDGDSAAYSVEETGEKGKHKITFSAIRIRALTAVAIPAFAEAKIVLTGNKPVQPAADTEEFCDDVTETPEGEALRKKRQKANKTWTYGNEDAENLIAAGAPIRPPGEWFDGEGLPGPTPLTVLDDGQVFGHIALWGTCHIGMPKCTAPPKGGTYAYFHTGALATAEGDEVSVGHLTFNTGHASVYDNAFNAASHYDHTGAVAADVVAGEDKFGIWVAGAMRPHLTDEEVRIFKAAPISGDWRRIGARLELVAALSVNTPGFPVPRTSNVRTKVLVAGGQEEAFITMAKQGDFESFGRQAYKDDLVTRVNNTFQTDSTEETDFSETWGEIFDDNWAFATEGLDDVELEEFYNQCHDQDGHFCEGDDGPGRLRDNNKKSEEILGKKAPQYMKDLLSRKRGAAVKQGQALLPESAPQHMKDMMKRKMEESVHNPKSPARSTAKATAPASPVATVEAPKVATAPKAIEAPKAAVTVTKPAVRELKKEVSGKHPASDYAYTPEADKSSGWKLRLTSKPGGKPDAKMTAAAAQALSPGGFRGRQVQLPAAERPKVIAKVRSAWLSAHKDKSAADLPDVLKIK